jgi:hypothetical protein
MTQVSRTVELAVQVARLERENAGLRSERDEAEQVLGRLLGYPEHPEWRQIITAPHTLLSLCDEVVSTMNKLVTAIDDIQATLDKELAKLNPK